jgi:hypothetical protein
MFSTQTIPTSNQIPAVIALSIRPKIEMKVA